MNSRKFSTNERDQICIEIVESIKKQSVKSINSWHESEEYKTAVENIRQGKLHFVLMGIIEFGAIGEKTKSVTTYFKVYPDNLNLISEPHILSQIHFACFLKFFKIYYLPNSFGFFFSISDISKVKTDPLIIYLDKNRYKNVTVLKDLMDETDNLT
jgi:hypothetical protein